MNEKEPKLSITGKVTRQILTTTNGMEFKIQKILAAFFFEEGVRPPNTLLEDSGP